jgi:hypothetical protein
MNSRAGAFQLAACLAAGMAVFPAVAHDDPVQDAPQATSAASTTASTKAAKVSAYRAVNLPSRAKNYYQSAWGIDNMLVRQTASGNLIRFSYRVVDPARAKQLGDKQATAYLLGLRSHAMLHVPVMDKIGQLRQTGTPDADTEYWMVFSNKGNLVKPGDRVNVVIGSFHADGLLVE